MVDNSNRTLLIIAGVVIAALLVVTVFLLRKPAPQETNDLSWGELGELGVTAAKIYYGAV